MKMYDKNGQLAGIVCNKCGKFHMLENGIFKSDIASFDKEWGYFSDKDGTSHQFDLCEECYDKITAEFRHPVTVTEQTELV